MTTGHFKNIDQAFDNSRIDQKWILDIVHPFSTPLQAIPADFGWREDYTLNWSPVNRRAHRVTNDHSPRHAHSDWVGTDPVLPTHKCDECTTAPSPTEFWISLKWGHFKMLASFENKQITHSLQCLSSLDSRMNWRPSWWLWAHHPHSSEGSVFESCLRTLTCQLWMVVCLYMPWDWLATSTGCSRQLTLAPNRLWWDFVFLYHWPSMDCKSCIKPKDSAEMKFLQSFSHLVNLWLCKSWVLKAAALVS